MAENRTKPTTVSPRAFIAEVESAQRRKDALELLTLMQDITGTGPKMWGPSIIGFDKYRYAYASGCSGEAPLTGFSPRKQELVLYLGPGLDNKRLMARLGRHKAGKGCLYIKRLDDVDRGVLRELVSASVAAMRERYPSDEQLLEPVANGGTEGTDSQRRIGESKTKGDSLDREDTPFVSAPPLLRVNPFPPSPPLSAPPHPPLSATKL